MRRASTPPLPLRAVCVALAAILLTGSTGDLRRQAITASRQAEALDTAVARADRAAAAALDAAAATAARIEAARRDVARARTRVTRIDRLRAAQRRRLAEKRAPVARLAAAIQLMARRPAVLALVSPGSVADIIHTRALLDAAVPAIAARTADLRAEVADGDRLRRAALRAVAALDDGRRRLAAERQAMLALANTRTARADDLADAALGASDRAIALDAEARDEAAAAAHARAQAPLLAALASLPGPALRPGTPPAPSAMAQDWHLPVAGRLVAGFGEITGGARNRGLTLAPPPDSMVSAPQAGRVAFAGPFAGYGRIVILAHAGGWTTLVAGLKSLAVATGQSVAPGAPLGTAAPRVTIERRHGDRPVDVAATIADGG